MIDLSLSACVLRDVGGGGILADAILSGGTVYRDSYLNQVMCITQTSNLGQMNDPKLEVLAWRFDL